jgi:hypothetical protein
MALINLLAGLRQEEDPPPVAAGLPQIGQQQAPPPALPQIRFGLPDSVQAENLGPQGESISSIPQIATPPLVDGVPVTGDLATRDRRVAMPPPAPTAPAQAMPTIGDLQRRELEVLDDPNRYKEGGANRNKKWSWLEKLGAGALGWLQGGLGGAIRAGTDRNYFQKMEDSQKREELLPKIARTRAMEDQDLQRDWTKERITNQRRDDARREGEFQTTQQGLNLRKLMGQKHFNPDDPSHAALAKGAGLDPAALKGWDDRNRVTKQIGGITYERNPATGAYERTNLPADEAKSLTEYTVEMPTGELRTYKVSQRDAASFATQMKTLGLRLEQQENQFSRRLEFDQQKFGQAKSEFERVMKEREAARLSGDSKAAANLDARLTQMMQWTAKALGDRKIDQGMHDILMETIGGIGGRY